MPAQHIATEAEGRLSEAQGALMRANRLHKRGEPLKLDLVPRPKPRSYDVLVKVKACGIVPNFLNVLQYGEDNIVRQPPLPAIFGLDVAGVVAEKGELVRGVDVGDRVYVNPLRYCGACHFCRQGKVEACDYLTLNGYFGMGSKADKMFEAYPYGGYAEYMTAPQYSLVKLPGNVSFEAAARWGYMGTGYGALRRGGADMNTTVLINGASGTLGVGATIFALALGVPKVLGVGRNMKLLERLKAIDPERIEVHSAESEISVGDWARARTEGRGADVIVDALPSGSPAEAFMAGLDALAKCGRHANCGGTLVPTSIDTPRMMVSSQTMIGSNWFSTAHGQEMANLAASGRVNLDVFEHHVFALEDMNTALKTIDNRNGGFTNYVVSPEARPVRQA